MGPAVIRWWNTDPESISARPGDGVTTFPDWGNDGLPIILGFGDHPVALEREEFAGDYDQMRAAMLDRLRIHSERPLPEGAVHPPGEAELLAYLATHEPAQILPGGARIDHVDGPLNLFVVSVPNPANPPANAALDLTATHRVACWGLSFPSGDGVWTSYLFFPEHPGAAERSFDGTELLPNGVRRVISLSSRAGDTLLSFEGAGVSQDLERAVAERLTAAGFASLDGWRGDRSAQGRSARFERRRDDATTRADVLLLETADGRITGLLQLHTTSTRGTQP